jgi:signal transduction histidine kinase
MQLNITKEELQRDERQRLHDILDALPKQAYDDVVQLAVALFQTPIASIVLVDSLLVRRKSGVGLSFTSPELIKNYSFASRVVAKAEGVVIVEDAMQDAVFALHPYVTGVPGVRFYAGAPIVATDGTVAAVISIMDIKVRTLSAQQCELLQCLARQVAVMLEVRQRSEREAGQVYRENQYLQALTLSGTDLQMVIDRNYCYRYVNQVFLDYWQRRREAVEGRTVVELLGQDLFDGLYKNNVDKAMSGEHVTIDMSFDYPAFGQRYVRTTFLPAKDKRDNIIGAVVRVEDISDLREVEMSLRHTVHLLEEKKLDLQRFIYILSHDLREPVNTILNFSRLLRERFAEESDEQVRKFLEFVYKGGERMRSLLEDLLKYVRVDSNEPDRAPVPLDEVFQEVKQDLSAVLERTHTQIVSDPLPVVRGDRHMLRVLLQNLIENAIKFVAPGIVPSVQVTAVTDMDTWQLTVTDNGIGVRDEHRELIFDLFKRLHSRKQYEGTGLGLATCRRIAELHGGCIWVTATPQGGSDFHVLLPRRK